MANESKRLLDLLDRAGVRVGPGLNSSRIATVTIGDAVFLSSADCDHRALRDLSCQIVRATPELVGRRGELREQLIAVCQATHRAATAMQVESRGRARDENDAAKAAAYAFRSWQCPNVSTWDYSKGF